jgi:predicted phosphodiesterase
MSISKDIKDVGARNGKLLFFGGVYSNLQALEALKKWADVNDYLPENIFCTGDIAGYCAQPLECFQLIREWGVYPIAGNVELQLRENEDDCGCDFKSGGRCDMFSRNWYNYARSKMNPEALQWLSSLPHHIQFTFGNIHFTIVHGSWFHTSEFIFESTAWETKKQNFDATGSDVIVAGHCGIPFIVERQGCTWLNPGVIGMPANDGSDKVWFATAENQSGQIEFRFHRLEYNHKPTIKLMLEHHLPVTYARTLETGIWDNCEILPEAEANKQGMRIELESRD